MSSDAESMCELDPKVKRLLSKVDYEVRMCRAKIAHGLPVRDNLSRIRFLQNALRVVEKRNPTLERGA